MESEKIYASKVRHQVANSTMLADQETLERQRFRSELAKRNFKDSAINSLKQRRHTLEDRMLQKHLNKVSNEALHHNVVQ